MRYAFLVIILLFAGNVFALEIKSNAFKQGESIPVQYTCEGEDVSPDINWSDVPVGTQSFVLICDDPDAPSGTWVHWVIFNIPGGKTGLSQALSKQPVFEDGTVQGTNDFGNNGFGGPCPPPYKPHRYFFRLYAVNTKLNLGAKATKKKVLEAIAGHICGQAEFYGTYAR